MAIVLSLLFLPAVQTIIAKKALNYVFAEDTVDFGLGRIAITPFSVVEVSGLYLSDQEKDTLLFANSLKVYLGDWNVSPFELKFDSVILDHSKFYISIHDGDSISNLQFVIDRFSSNSRDTSAIDYQLKFATVRMNKVFFHWNDFNFPDTAYGVIFQHI